MTQSTVPTVSINGKNFVYSPSGNSERFMVRGVALSNNDAIRPGYTDLLADAHFEYLQDTILPKLQALNVNVIRVYSVDEAASHAQAMALLTQNGIYVMVGLATAQVSINRVEPAYPVALYNRACTIIDEFQTYTNTFCFSTSNELVFPGVIYNYAHTSDPTHAVEKTIELEKAAASANKSLIRDLKAYMSRKSYRAIPVGMAMQDGPQASVSPSGIIGTDIVAEYYAAGAVSERADFIGINTYRYLPGGPMQSYDGLATEAASLAIPVLITESGAINMNDKQVRDWKIAPHVFKTASLYDQLSGQIAFQFFDKQEGLGLYTQTPVGGGPLTETTYGGADNLGTQFQTCEGLTVPMAPAPSSSTTHAPTNFDPAMTGFDTSITVKNLDTTALKLLQGGGVIAQVEAGTPTNPTVLDVKVIGGLSLNLQQFVAPNTWNQVCGVPANTLQDGDVVSTPQAAWGGTCTVN